MNRTKLLRFLLCVQVLKTKIDRDEYFVDFEFDEFEVRTIYLPGVFVEEDSGDAADAAVAALVARADGLFDFDSLLVYGETLAIGFFCEFSAEFADWNSDDHVFEGAATVAAAATAPTVAD